MLLRASTRVHSYLWRNARDGLLRYIATCTMCTQYILAAEGRSFPNPASSGVGERGCVSWEHLEGRQTVVCVVQAVPEKGCECNGMAWGWVFMGKRREHRRIGKRQEGPHRAAGAREGSTYLGRHVHVPQYLPSARVSAQSVHRPAVCGGGREDVPCAVPGTELGGPPPQRLPVDQPQLLIFQIDPPLQHADDNML